MKNALSNTLIDVSIHAPREGCDSADLLVWLSQAPFQFTHPGRGATWHCHYCNWSGTFQFTHPGRGATARAKRFR